MNRTISFFLLMPIIIFLSCNNNNEDDLLQQRVLQLQDSLKYYQSENDSTNKVLTDSSIVNSFFGKHEIAKLRMHGLKNAPQQVIDSLNERTDLIPYKAELGGSMRFWNIQLLKMQWVIAAFTDGHVTGDLLLSYQLKEDGRIEWKLLDSYLE